MMIAQTVFSISFFFLMLYMWVPPRYLFPYLDDDEY